MVFSKRKTIGVFLCKVFDAFDSAVFHALEQEGRRLDYDIVVFTTAGYYLSQSDYDMQEKNIFRLAAIDKLDGILIAPDTYEQGGFRELLFEMLRNHARCPIVAIRHDSTEYDCAFTDESEAIRPLIRHLIEDHGLKKICFQKGFPGHMEANARLAVYEQEMAAHGLPIPKHGICPGTMWSNCGEEGYAYFFADPDDPPEAVVCANDYMAVGMMRALEAHGLRVPEDVIVTGFDNLVWSGSDMPSLTTIQPDYTGMVVQAMRHLDRRIRGEQTDAGQVRFSMPGKLILGESCGCGKRSSDYFRKVCKRTATRLEQVNAQDSILNNISIDLGACDDLTELHEVLINKRADHRIVRDQYLCLFGEPGALMQEAGDRACLVHAIRDRRDCGMPMISFDRSSLLPPMAERPDEPQVFFVKLLHQKGHNFGYCVWQYIQGEAPSRIFVQVNALLSIALENIYRKGELMRLYEERRLSSITDMMTGLLNRRGLLEKLEPEWQDLLGRSVAFVCIDMDRLKRINDTYGHAAGDYAIRLVGRAIQQALPKKGLGARIGGDEFLVFLPEAGDGEPEALVRSFNAALDELNRQEDRSFQVTASAGYQVKRLEALDTIEHCIQLSDRQLYRVKEARHAEEVQGAGSRE